MFYAGSTHGTNSRDITDPDYPAHMWPWPLNFGSRWTLRCDKTYHQGHDTAQLICGKKYNWRS